MNDAPFHKRSPSQSRTTWFRPINNMPRCLQAFFIVMLALLMLAGLVRGLTDIRDQMVKQYATDFASLHQDNQQLWSPSNTVRHAQTTGIDDRYTYLHNLGHGKEGSTAVYIDNSSGETVVVKTFSTTARNAIPHHLHELFREYTTMWPAEIEAGLLLGRSSSNSSFVPVVDYFILENGHTWCWALVSPFIHRGTLDKLAESERNAHSRSVEETDHVWRSALNDLLRGLAPLHEAGLCHDDIKHDNIFVESPQHWLLGDLGNLRHTSHAWHYTRSWNRQNQWSDCRNNDLRRALKTYLWFLRSASVDIEAFDYEFWKGEQRWSRPYWDFVQKVRDGKSLSAHDLIESHSSGLEKHEDSPNASSAMEAMHHSSRLSNYVERELICTTIPRRLWK